MDTRSKHSFLWITCVIYLVALPHQLSCQDTTDTAPAPGTEHPAPAEQTEAPADQPLTAGGVSVNVPAVGTEAPAEAPAEVPTAAPAEASTEAPAVKPDVTEEPVEETEEPEEAEEDGVITTSAPAKEVQEPVITTEEKRVITKLPTEEPAVTSQAVQEVTTQPPVITTAEEPTTESPNICNGTVFEILDGDKRHVSVVYDKSQRVCDDQLKGWYAFRVMDQWAVIPHVYVKPNLCGSEIGLRLVEPLLSLHVGEEGTTDLCGSFSIRANSVEKCIMKLEVNVKRCDDHYIYYLPGFDGAWCDMTFCTQLPEETITEEGELELPPVTTLEPLNINSKPYSDLSEEEQEGVVTLRYKTSDSDLDTEKYNEFNQKLLDMILTKRKEMETEREKEMNKSATAVKVEPTQQPDMEQVTAESEQQPSEAASSVTQVIRRARRSADSGEVIHVDGTPRVKDGHLESAILVKDEDGNVIPRDELLAILAELDKDGTLKASSPSDDGAYAGAEPDAPEDLRGSSVAKASSSRDTIWEAHIGLWIAVLVMIAVCLLICCFGCICIKCCPKDGEEKMPLRAEEGRGHPLALDNPAIEEDVQPRKAPMVEHEDPAVTSNSDGVHLRPDDENGWIVPMDQLTQAERNKADVENTKL